MTVGPMAIRSMTATGSPASRIVWLAAIAPFDYPSGSQQRSAPTPGNHARSDRDPLEPGDMTVSRSGGDGVPSTNFPRKPSALSISCDDPIAISANFIRRFHHVPARLPSAVVIAKSFICPSP